jgi:predicted HAD superfamily Cof-like phosphohydrolase
MYGKQIDDDNQDLVNQFGHVLKKEQLDYLVNHNNPFNDVKEFNRLYSERTGRQSPGKLDAQFLIDKVHEEMDEIKANMDDPVNVVDGALDAMYFICQILTFSRPDLDFTRMWKLVHKANLTKFNEKGHLDKDGKKWIKPHDFIAPDDEIRQCIENPKPK